MPADQNTYETGKYIYITTPAMLGSTRVVPSCDASMRWQTKEPTTVATSNATDLPIIIWPPPADMATESNLQLNLSPS